MNSNYTIVGLLTLSPMSVAPVCHVGDPLQITCTSSESGIKWSSIFQGSDVLITSGGPNNQQTQVTADSVTFTFTRTSNPGVSPLVSTLSIDSVSIGLNGTVVRCADLADPMISVAATLKIIDTINQSEFVNVVRKMYILYSCTHHRFPAIHSNIEGFRRELRGWSCHSYCGVDSTRRYHIHHQCITFDLHNRHWE